MKRVKIQDIEEKVCV